MKNSAIFISLAACLLYFNSLPGQEAESQYKKGEHKFLSGNYEEATEDFSKTLEIDSNHLNALSKRAFCYSFNGRYEEAIADFDKVIRLKPDYMQGYLSRGSAKNKLQKYSQAMVDFNKVLSMDPKNTEALNNRGWAKKGMNDHAGACDDWQQSKKLGNAEAKIIMKNNQCK